MPTVASAPRLATLMRYKAWADTRLYAALASVPPDTLAKPTPVFAGSILRTLNHVCLIDVVWKSHLLGVPHGFVTRNPEASRGLAELRQAQAATDAWYVRQAEHLTPPQADETVHFAFIGGGTGAMTRGEIMLHVVNHTTYHRGHISAMLYLAGVQSPVTDLPVYLREPGHAR
ncbi:MAG: DUF664 domain-containing protein [Rhodanobacteraceae bacterium]|nr:MAG: DUF664 domain-containing protein [Rhodanobacteraceae bacterium]